ncbi:MAG: tripartite tricarboxylate transporter substrate binding protein [Betaproteobacteria bacterium]|nr:tripartite tricarboxylate transporter substrate binding protein [Betaproteobacteria bacterium]
MNHPRACCILIALTTAEAYAQAPAQPYPTRPIRMMVPFSPGGASDLAARVVGQKLSERLGQQVVVDNRPGAGGALGTELAVKAPADGYNLLMGSSTEITINPHLYKKLTYDTQRDFAPVTHVASTPLLIVVHPSLPAKNVKELITLAKARPGQLFAASSGNGSSTHLGMEMFKSAAKIDMVHVPHNGSAPAVVSTMTGEAQIYFGAMPAVLQQANAGRLRALAITSAKRRAAVPEIPTVIEGGLPGYEILIWNALFAPRATPPAIIARLNGEVNKILELPDIREAFNKQGAEVSGSTPEQLAAYVASEYAKWAKVVAASGAKLD